MKEFAFVFTAAAVLVAAPLSAQWTAVAPNQDGAEFWDNPSDDGNMCNAGYILTNAATGGCNNQRPAGWLPYTGTAMDFFWGAGGSAPNLLFGAGTYSFSLISGTSADGGDVAGQNRDWGYYTDAGLVNLNIATFPVNNVVIASTWGIWVSMTSGAIAYSGSSSQFALFINSTTGENVFGLEDINTGQGGGSDRDFNDMFFSVDSGDTPLEVVPEPATMTLLATGLVGMAAARRRKKNQS